MTDLFDESFVEQLPSDPLEALDTIITFALAGIEVANSMDEKFERAVQAYTLVREYSAAFAPQFSANVAQDLSPSDKGTSLNIVVGSFQAVRRIIETEHATQSVASYEDRAKALIGKVEVIEFTDGDLNRLQKLIDEMRGITTQTEELGKRHRRRILERLEKLQAEIHKRVTKLDQAWLLMPEIGLALGSFGKNAAPMWDRLNETLRIIAGAEARRAELPSTYEPPFIPKLELDENSGDDDDSQEPDITPPA